jgi:C-terminal processing protease CtpA/Prc
VRDLYEGSIRDSRPKTGAEVAPGVYYIDFDTLSASAWSALLSTLQRARGLIFDFRGYLASGAFASLANLSDQTLLAPRMQIPLVGLRGLQQPPSQWSIRPAQPRLATPVVVLTDGQSMSAVETFLQIFHDNHLGYVVGESSGGTNGDMNTFSVPGGFLVRFTGLRVTGGDGTAIQGRGVVPDEVVHPTQGGVRAGRDEILEAGMAAAQRLAPK